MPRRRPRLWPAVAGLAITALVLAGCFAVLIAGLRATYHERADRCAAVDVGPIARLFGPTPLKGVPDTGGFDCMAAVGDSPEVPTAIVGLSVVYHDSMFEARLAYEQSDDADQPGKIDLPGGKRGRLVATRLPGGGCAIQAALQDVNVMMTARLTFPDQAKCVAPGPAADALAETMRGFLSRLA